MAATYDPLGTQTVPEVTNLGNVVDVLQVSAQAKPAGTVFNVRFGPDVQDAAVVDEILAIWAGWYNDIAALPNVQNVSTYQDIDANNQLRDVAQITVASDSGKSTKVVEVTDEQVGTPQVAPLVAQAAAFLNAIEGL